MRFIAFVVAFAILATPLAIATPPPARAAYSFSDDFETGDITQWDDSLIEAGGTLEVIAGAAKNGSFGLHAQMTGANDDVKAAKDVSASGHTLTYVRAWFQYVTPPGGNTDQHHIIASNDSLGALDCSLGVDDGTDLEHMMFDCVGFQRGLSAYTEDTWHCVEGYWDSASGSEMWVDGTSVRTSTSTFASTELAFLQLGNDGGNQTFDVYFDDYYSDSTTTSSQYSAFGDDCVDSGGPEPTPTPTPAPTPAVFVIMSSRQTVQGSKAA